MKRLWMIPMLAVAVASSSATADNAISTPNSYNPFEEMRQMQQEMDKIFEKFHQRMTQEDLFKSFPATFPSTPAVDFRDTGDKYLLKADIPGAKESEIHIKTKDGVLTIEAKSIKEKKEEKSGKEAGFIRHERYEGVYIRSLTLPEDADADKLKSDYKNGVLEITIPKKKR